jgi:hypothetical protein
MSGGHSAACRPARAADSSAAVARSMKPGLLGAKGRKVSRAIPACSAACRKRARSSTNLAAVMKLGKSVALTAQFHSSFVGVLASPSASIRGCFTRCAMVPYLTTVGLSQRDDAHCIAAQRIGTSVEPPKNAPICKPARFAIVVSGVGDDLRPRPIQPRRVGQRQPMLAPVLRILHRIPLELHAPDVARSVMNNRLTGDPQ